MHLALAGMRLLEIMFFTGLVGSVFVVAFSLVQDIDELSRKDEEPGPAKNAQTAR